MLHFKKRPILSNTSNTSEKVQKMQHSSNNHQIQILPNSPEKCAQHSTPHTYQTTYQLKNLSTSKQTTFTIYYDEDLHFYISYNNYLLPSYLFSTSYEGDPEDQILNFIFIHFTHLLNQHQHKINPLPYLFFNSSHNQTITTTSISNLTFTSSQ